MPRPSEEWVIPERQAPVECLLNLLRERYHKLSQDPRVTERLRAFAILCMIDYPEQDAVAVTGGTAASDAETLHLASSLVAAVLQQIPPEEREDALAFFARRLSLNMEYHINLRTATPT